MMCHNHTIIGLIATDGHESATTQLTFDQAITIRLCCAITMDFPEAKHGNIAGKRDRATISVSVRCWRVKSYHSNEKRLNGP